MTDYNWCHGPNCHTEETQSRVRGSKGNKVLRTIKIKQGRYNGYQNGIWDYFCNNRCLFDFIKTHLTSIVAIAPRREPLETPVKVVKEKYQNHRTEWNDQGSGYKEVPYMSTRITIKSVDND